MSLFGDLEDDPLFGFHMRHGYNVMNSLMGIPDFGLSSFPFAGGRAMSQNSLMPHSAFFGARGGFPIMPSMNRLLSSSFDNLGDPSHSHHSYSSSTVYSMSSGPDGRAQVYKASTSTRTAPGGIRETQKTVCDSLSGTKKMSIGHHIGERGHIIEREENVHSGDKEERQDFINLEEEEADDFNREWATRSRPRSEIPRITGPASIRNRYGYGDREGRMLPAITAGPSRRSRDRTNVTSPMVSSRRSIRPNALASPVTSSSMASTSRHPYNPASHSQVKKNKNIKTVSGSPPQDM